MSNTSTSQNKSTQKAKQKTAGSYIKGLALILFSLLTLLALSGVGYGRFNELLANTWRWLVGGGAYLLALLMGIQGLLLLRGRSWRTYVSWAQLLALELLFLCLLGIWCLNSNETLALHANVLKSSGGLLGWTLAFLVSPFGITGGKAFLSLCILLLLPVLFKLPLTRIQNMLANQQQKVNDWQTTLQLPAPADQAAFAAATSAQRALPSYPSARSGNRSSGNRANRPQNRTAANQPVHQRVRAAGGSPVSTTKSVDPVRTPSPYQSAAPLTRPLPKRVAHDLIPPKTATQRPLPIQKQAVQPPREEAKPVPPARQPVARQARTEAIDFKKKILTGSDDFSRSGPPETPYVVTTVQQPERKINTVVPVSVVNQLKRNDLPPFDILQQHSDKVDPLEAQEKARLIEETLEDLGVPVTVVEINQGPRITQFGVEPGFIETAQRDGSVKRRKVKANAIKALSDDLALALAARSIRIQLRVPGRTYVGIELPNDEFETVTLHSVLTSQAYLKIKGDLVIALGRDVTGQSVAADISRMPHMLIAGATGSGKSVCINAIIASLLFNLGPDQLKLLLIDPKMVELVPYNGIPHLNTPVVTNMEKVVGSLSWAVREMERRYTLFSDARKRNLQSYNKWAKSSGHDTLPYIVIIIDELADLMMVAADEVEQIICRLAQMARATGIHLILATQRPSVDVVTGLIKANIPTRISFSVASGTDSRVILDSTGAEDLLGLGDMLYQASDASRLQRIQGCYVSDEELQELVDYWLHAKAKKALSEIFQQKPPSTPIFQEQNTQKAAHQGIRRKEENPDELLAKAIALLKQNQSISISVLQRKLRISYMRAARIIKELKKQGLIGAPKK